LITQLPVTSRPWYVPAASGPEQVVAPAVWIFAAAAAPPPRGKAITDAAATDEIIAHLFLRVRRCNVLNGAANTTIEYPFSFWRARAEKNEGFDV
jgi:hypothetical protein